MVGAQMVDAHTAPPICTIYSLVLGHAYFAILKIFRRESWSTVASVILPPVRRKCNAVSNLFLDIVTQNKEVGPRKVLFCILKTLFSNRTLSHWHGSSFSLLLSV